jgi:hypothetical protein
LLSSLHIQIIIDIVFFITIVVLLHQLDKRIVKNQPALDEAVVCEFKKLMTDSQDSTIQFLRVIEEHEQRLNKLSRQFDNKENRLIIIIEEAEALIKRIDSQKISANKIFSDEERAKQIIRMIQEGISREKVAKRLGVTEGEIDLITELEQIKKGNP